MSKKEKKSLSLAEDFQAVITMLPKLKGLIEAHKEIAAGYQMYRKNGGDEIPGIEKHLGLKEQISEPSDKTKKTEAEKIKKKDK